MSMVFPIQRSYLYYSELAIRRMPRLMAAINEAGGFPSTPNGPLMNLTLDEDQRLDLSRALLEAWSFYRSIKRNRRASRINDLLHLLRNGQPQEILDHQTAPRVAPSLIDQSMQAQADRWVIQVVGDVMVQAKRLGWNVPYPKVKTSYLPSRKRSWGGSRDGGFVSLALANRVPRTEAHEDQLYNDRWLWKFNEYASLRDDFWAGSVLSYDWRVPVAVLVIHEMAHVVVGKMTNQAIIDMGFDPVERYVPHGPLFTKVYRLLRIALDYSTDTTAIPTLKMTGENNG